MSAAATGLAIRSVVRRNWRSIAMLGVLTGAASAFVAAPLAGAARVEHAYTRLAEAVDAPDLYLECPSPCDDDSPLRSRTVGHASVADVDAVSLQFVAITAPSAPTEGVDPIYLGPSASQPCATGAGELDLVAWDRAATPPARLVSGRFPDPARDDEVALAEVTARRAGVGVGDLVYLAAGNCGSTPHFLGQARPLTVVGIAVGPTDVRPLGQSEYFENVYAAPRLLASTGFETNRLLAVRLRPGATPSAVATDVGAENVVDMDERAASIQRALRPDATTLRLFALVTLVALAAVLAQLIGRWTSASTRSLQQLRPLGATRTDLALAGMACTAVIGSVGAVAAAPSTWIAGHFVPLGGAGPIERGTSDPRAAIAMAVAAGGALAFAAVVAVVPALRGAAALRPMPHHSVAPLSRAMGRVFGWRPAPALGTRIAFQTPVRGPTAFSGIGAIVIAVATIAGVVTSRRTGSGSGTRAVPSRRSRRSTSGLERSSPP